jgi:hypothetical protein
MKKHDLTEIAIDALAPSTLTARDERREPVSLDGGDYPSKPETRRRVALRGFIDTLAFAGAAMAEVNVSVRLDEPNVSGETSSKDETSPRQHGVATASRSPDGGRLIEFFPKIERSTRNSGEEP